MTRFAYTARDARGQLINGLVQAMDVSEAGRQLRSEGKFIVKLAEARGADIEPQAMTLDERYGRVRRDDVIYFVHQMSVMIETGVTLGEALESIADQTPNEHFKAIMQDVSEHVHGGQAFSEALARHSRIFPPLMISLVRASEASGTMGIMLERIGEYMTKERNTLKAVRGAMVYPCIMLFVAMGVTIFLLTFVLPRFGKIYTSRGAALPAPTQLLLSASHILTAYWYVWVACIAGAIGFVLYARTRGWGRHAIDWLKLHLPVIGKLMNQLYVTRAMRTMGTMISAGVPMLDMIAITREVTTNHYFRLLWDTVDDRLRQGSQLSASLGDSRLIPPSVLRMIQSGEKAGRLGVVMDRIAVFTEHDFDESCKQTTQFIEPLMIAFMGSFVGFVAISLLLPIFSVGRVMAGK
ncbi:MAG: type II secretion system F family protein [Phycisphaeraceae bacterium]